MTQDTTLYHYCSSSTFASIVLGRSIWLSSLSLSNDSLEGRLVRDTLLRVAERDSIEAGVRQQLKQSLVHAERWFEGLGFCLSEDGDLLSQWRAYADNAAGVAIGFSSSYLIKLSEEMAQRGETTFKLHKVEYDRTKHDALMEPAYRELRGIVDTGAFRSEDSAQLRRDVRVKLAQLVPKFYELKTDGFREEREWRLVSFVIGMAKASPPDPVRFRAVQGRIVPYRTFDLVELDMPPIREVVIGPRHATPVHVLGHMMQFAGFGEVAMRHSLISYR